MSEASRGQAFILAVEPTADKLRRWQRAILHTFGAMDMRIRDDARFTGTIRRVPFAGLELTDVCSSSECARRTRRHLAADTHEMVALLLVRQGLIQLDHYGRQSLACDHSFTLLDLNEPYDWVHAQPAHVIGIKLPKRALSARVPDLGAQFGRVRSAARGVGRLAADFINSFASEVETLPESAGAALERHFLELTELLLTAPDSDPALPRTSSGAAIHARALAFIDRHIADRDLSPEAIAQAMPISLRYLHAIFQSCGTTVGETILSRRLALCYSRLAADPRLRVGDIAARAGFKSHAHFSQAFKRRYDASPRDVRGTAAPILRKAPPQPVQSRPATSGGGRTILSCITAPAGSATSARTANQTRRITIRARD